MAQQNKIVWTKTRGSASLVIKEYPNGYRFNISIKSENHTNGGDPYKEALDAVCHGIIQMHNLLKVHNG